MKRKIISLKTFQKRKKIWINNFNKNPKIKQLSKKLFVEADKNNYSYFYSWKGETFLQTAEDIITLQEIIYDLQPQTIIEVGVAWGGTMLFYDSLAKGSDIKDIIGVDIYIPKDLKQRLKKKSISKKITLLEMDSLHSETLKKIMKIMRKNKRTLIHLDSHHSKNHVYNELCKYSKLLKKNDIIIVGDTIIESIPAQTHRPRPWGKGNSPKNALDDFLKENKNFKILKEISDKQLLSNNPNGYIKKV